MKGKSSIGKTFGGGFGIFMSALLAMRGGCKICCDVMVIMGEETCLKLGEWLRCDGDVLSSSQISGAIHW